MQASLGQAHRYPDTRELQARLAALHKVKAEQVVLGCGSSEIMRLAAEAFLKPGKTLVMATPTFPLILFYARNLQAPVIQVPLTRGLTHDLNAMLAACDKSTGLVYLCNPNNPTATLTARQDLEAFLHKLPGNVPVMIDEAYHHYAVGGSQYSSFLDQPIADGRTIVTRTFSKAYGLAGMRIGYAVAPAALAQQMSERRLQFAENQAGLKAAMAALDDSEHVTECVRKNTDDRQEFVNAANGRMVTISDSHTNFMLMKIDHPVDAVIEHFRKNNILLGPRFPGLDKHVRVSLGKPEEMREFWRVWDMLPHEVMQH